MLPLPLSYAPMEAKLVNALPTGDAWQYEPKWDGFRCLIFRDGDEIALQSKAGQPLQRYFPEVVEHVRALPAGRFVADGELIVAVGDHLSFDDLLQRIHPAASRIARLAAERPAMVILFDLLVDADGRVWAEAPLVERRAALEKFASKHLGRSKEILLSPTTREREQAERWLLGSGDAVDGVVAKRLDSPYQSGERAMQKVKRMQTADCVVGGFRYASNGPVIGSLLLGLYGEDGLLHHVGFSAGFTASERKELVPLLEPLIEPPGFTGRAPGGPSRWSNKRSDEWQPLALKLVVEVAYDHFSGGRFRHGTRFLRWRPDKAPQQCLMEQVEQEGGIAPLKLLAPAQPAKAKSARTKRRVAR
ncbi:MAG TPA: ATP-dependent DNA ligase [Terriglobales bacterium]|nr:ATP-dependent DNA ligase [Terriglobales bacterium]